MSKVRPTDIKLHQASRLLEIEFDSGERFSLGCEYLRVYSPSAEVQGHGPGQQVLQTGKENVNITNIEMVGNYAIRLIFDDGHDSGIYSWELLHRLGVNRESNMADYQRRLRDAGYKPSEDDEHKPNGSGHVVKI